MKEIKIATEAILDADALLIGASNGLSISEGFNIFADNEMFRSKFCYFQRKYGIRCMLEGFFFHYPSQSERQRFLDDAVKYWVTEYVPSDVMQDLRIIVGDKDYFIVTTNGDTHFELSGFNSNKIFEIENTFVRVAKNLPVEDKSRQLQEFLTKYSGKKIVILELGIGRNNRIIKPLLFQVARNEPHSVFIAMNMPSEISVPQHTASVPIEVPGDIAVSFKKMLEYNAPISE